MKWLLITTAQRSKAKRGSNVGDEFAMLGCRKVIESVDAKAEFDLLDKESANDWDKEHPHNKVVICGMPLLWSLPEQACSDIYWWDYLWNSYVGHVKTKMLPLGIGHVLIGEPHDKAKYHDAIRFVGSKSWRVVVREPILGAPEGWVQSVCPSVFCNMDRQATRKYRLCNLMDKGGHFGYVTDYGKAWENQVPELAKILLRNKFAFVAHTVDELDVAHRLGWLEENILFYDSAQEYLDLYAQAEAYFGNRLHGAVVCAATGCPSWGVTVDSRVGMVSRVGGKTDMVTPRTLEDWIVNPQPSVPKPGYDPRTQFQRVRELVGRFMQSS